MKREAVRNTLDLVTALITPFREGKVDYVSFRRLLKSQISAGVKAFVINGTTAESPSLENHEVQTLFDVARGEVGSSVSLIVGVGLNSTEKTLSWAKTVEKWKPEMLLAVTPYYNKPPQRGLIRHFKALAEKVSLPIILYNVPQRTGVSLTTDTVVELSSVENIVGIKEASGNLSLGKEILDQTEDFFVLSGDDASFLDLILEGGSGVISVISHIIPKPLSHLISLAKKRDRSSLEEYKKYAKLVKALYKESNPIPVKMALHLMNLIDSPEMRLPLVSLSEELQDELKNLMNSLELL